jgi:tRNA threonylcarbamoyladenosine biosynthesis protein TsaB
MKILAIETSSTACSVALLQGEKMLSSHKIMPMQQIQGILPMIDEILRSAGLKISELDALAFGCGPGSFTGARIATCVMQGFGFATGLPLIPISSLAAFAQTAYQAKGWQNMLVAVDARMQQVYWAEYCINTANLAVLVGEERVADPETVVALSEQAFYGVGNAWDVYNSRFLCSPTAYDSEVLPTAVSVACLAQVKLANNEWVSAKDALPVYLREEIVAKLKTPLK